MDLNSSSSNVNWLECTVVDSWGICVWMMQMLTLFADSWELQKDHNFTIMQL